MLGALVEQGVRRGRAVLIEGESGIGKTRPLEAALAHARRLGIPDFPAAAEELERHQPLGAIAGCLGIWHRPADPRWTEIAQLIRSDRAPRATANLIGGETDGEYRGIEEIRHSGGCFVAIRALLCAAAPREARITTSIATSYAAERVRVHAQAVCMRR
jgi:hypothetical protein